MNINLRIRIISNETCKLDGKKKMKIQNQKKNYLKYGKGRYAYSTNRRRLVWENVIWPLFADLNKPSFSIKEYQIKRNEVCKNRDIAPRQISGGFISLLHKGIIKHEEDLYSLHHRLVPYINNKINLDYGTVLREIC